LIGEKLKQFKKEHPKILIVSSNYSKQLADRIYNRVKENPEFWHTFHIELGKTTHKLHPNQAKEMIRKNHDLHPNLSHENGLKTHRLHPNQASENGKLCHLKNPGLHKEIGKRVIEIQRRDPVKFFEGRSKGGKESMKTRRQKRPYWWDDVPFDNKQECEVAKLLLTKPIEGVNYQFSINSKLIDFYPCWTDKMFHGCLVEFHPWDFTGLTEEEYYRQRLNVIENSDYKGKELILITGFSKTDIEVYKPRN